MGIFGASPHMGEPRLLHGGTDPHREPVRVRNTRLFPFWEYDSSVAYFPPCPDKAESKQRAKRPPGHSGLKFWLVTTLRRARSLWSLRQALRLTPPAKISPCGHRPPFKWAGSCTSAFLCGFIGGRVHLGGAHIPPQCAPASGKRFSRGSYSTQRGGERYSCLFVSRIVRARECDAFFI